MPDQIHKIHCRPNVGDNEAQKVVFEDITRSCVFLLGMLSLNDSGTIVLYDAIMRLKATALVFNSNMCARDVTGPKRYCFASQNSLFGVSRPSLERAALTILPRVW